MKKSRLLLLILLTLGTLVACNFSKENRAEATFTGTISEIHETTAIIEIDEGEILNSGNRVSINLSVADEETFEVGDKVRVGYEGGIMESYPLQVKTVFVEKME